MPFVAMHKEASRGWMPCRVDNRRYLRVAVSSPRYDRCALLFLRPAPPDKAFTVFLRQSAHGRRHIAELRAAHDRKCRLVLRRALLTECEAAGAAGHLAYFAHADKTRKLITVLIDDAVCELSRLLENCAPRLLCPPLALQEVRHNRPASASKPKESPRPLSLLLLLFLLLLLSACLPRRQGGMVVLLAAEACASVVTVFSRTLAASACRTCRDVSGVRNIAVSLDDALPWTPESLETSPPPPEYADARRFTGS